MDEGGFDQIVDEICSVFTFDSRIENQLNKLALKDPERRQPQHCNMSVGKNVSDKQACENEPDAGDEVEQDAPFLFSPASWTPI